MPHIITSKQDIWDKMGYTTNNLDDRGVIVLPIQHGEFDRQAMKFDTIFGWLSRLMGEIFLFLGG
jgi:hypothetical protein